jgi:carbon monoxide dehydrogenase subunit G
MKVRLEKTFPMPASAEAAWALLQDIGGVAACMPGAKITEQVDATHYKGTVAVKLGPASLSFRGEIEVKGTDASTRTLHLFAKGTDTNGSSAASMDLTARIEAIDAASCSLAGDSEVSMSGKAASFGARMMGPVADQVIGQFAANFAARLKQAPPQDAAAPAQGAAAPAPEAKPLNALAIAWAVIKSWLRALLGKGA